MRCREARLCYGYVTQKNWLCYLKLALPFERRMPNRFAKELKVFEIFTQFAYLWMTAEFAACSLRGSC